MTWKSFYAHLGVWSALTIMSRTVASYVPTMTKRSLGARKALIRRKLFCTKLMVCVAIFTRDMHPAKTRSSFSEGDSGRIANAEELGPVEVDNLGEILSLNDKQFMEFDVAISRHNPSDANSVSF